jgi:hypothetical protein
MISMMYGGDMLRLCPALSQYESKQHSDGKQELEASGEHVD